MNKVSIIVPYVPIDEDTTAMTQECVDSFRRTMNQDLDEIVEVMDMERKGNAWAWNEGASRAKGEILLFADNDIVAIKWRDEMVNALDDFAVVFPSVFNLKNGELQGHLAGECWMVRREVFERLGKIDESYGSYFEDTDFFMRVINDGLRIGVAPASLVTHRSQGTFKKMWTQDKMKEVFDTNKAKYEAKFNGQYPYLN